MAGERAGFPTEEIAKTLTERGIWYHSPRGSPIFGNTVVSPPYLEKIAAEVGARARKLPRSVQLQQVYALERLYR